MHLFKNSKKILDYDNSIIFTIYDVITMRLKN